MSDHEDLRLFRRDILSPIAMNSAQLKRQEVRLNKEQSGNERDVSDTK